MAEQEKEPERMDAPNQQAVGQPPPWEQGTGGEAADPVEQQEQAEEEGPEQAEQPKPAEPEKPSASKRGRKDPEQ